MSQWHSKQAQELAQASGVNPQVGLTDEEAALRLKKFGENKLVEERKIRFLRILKEEITEPMILLLFAIGVLYIILGYYNFISGYSTDSGFTDALTIIVIIIVLVTVEVWNEYRAKRSVASLKQLAPPAALVVRNDKIKEIATSQLVPGDILILKMGQRVPADARLLEAYGLEVDESSLTGESFPAQKDADTVLPSETKITDQTNMVFTGTIVTKGRAKALIVATGVKTELGRVVGITKAAKEPKTPLQLSMKQLSKSLVWIAIFFSVLIPVLSYFRYASGPAPLSPGNAVLYGLSLAFVVIPEELPIIITMVLGIGGYALSKKGAIVKRLRAAETLGNITVIATDKTGTLTENKMQIAHMYFDNVVTASKDFKENEKAALRTAFLASDAIKNLDGNILANPMANSIKEMLAQNGVDMQKIQQEWVLKDELSFDVKRKLASYIYQFGSSQVALSSGAPEYVLANSNRILLGGEEIGLTDSLRKIVNERIVQMAKAGERLLAFAYHRVHDKVEKQEVEKDLVFVGILGFVDPPRKEVKDAIRTCREAGIDVVMITGDHPETARAIAYWVGIDIGNVLTGSQISALSDQTLKMALGDTHVFARVSPEDKLRLVRLLKEKGEVVAVTGDGINDAPALKEAHIGIAMGIRGTDVAKETADMVLIDDNFATIETAVKEGRKLFGNLRKGVRYYLACKVALVSIFLVPIILGIPLPFSPIQIIVLELFMDLGASATFASEPEEIDVMRRQPRNSKEKFMNKSMYYGIIMGAASLAVAVTATYIFAYYNSLLSMTPIEAQTLAQTVAFVTWMFGHIFLAFNFRSEREPLTRLGLRSNKLMLIWAAAAIATVGIVVNVPGVSSSLMLSSLSILYWLLIFSVAFLATFWMEIVKQFRKSV